MKKSILIYLLSLFSTLSCGQNSNTSLLERAEIPYLKGESKKIFEAIPSPDIDKSKWFTNDHCFVTDKDGSLHWIGINNPYPPKKKELYRYHPYLGHLKSSQAIENWERLPFALDESAGTEYLGAPYIIWHNESKRWVMVVEVKFIDLLTTKENFLHYYIHDSQEKNMDICSPLDKLNISRICTGHSGQSISQGPPGGSHGR